MKQIKDHTYIINDKNVLEDVEKRLGKIYEKPLPHRLFLLILLLKNPLMKNDQTPIMKNYHIPDFENPNLLDALVAPMSDESFIVKYP